MNSDIKDGLYIFDRLIVSIVPITLVAKWPLDISLLTSFPTIAAACCLIVIIGYSKKKNLKRNYWRTVTTVLLFPEGKFETL